jgi:glutamate-1-semialdehyde 2,1-aminomutase
MASIFFTHSSVVDFDTAKKADSSRYASFYRDMLAQRIYLAPSPFESLFVSVAHNEEFLKKTIDAAFSSFKKMA